MKKSWILLIVGMLLLSSCVTQKACDRKFPPQVTTIVKDSVVTRDSIVEKLVEVPVYIKGDTVIKSDTVWRDKTTGLANSKPVYAETDFAKAKAQVVNSQLKLELIQKDSTFKVRTDSLLKEIYHWKELYKSKDTATIKRERYIPGVYNVFALIGLLYVIITILYFIFKFKDKLNLLKWPR